jgi:cytochrome c peroxidase
MLFCFFSCQKIENIKNPTSHFPTIAQSFKNDFLREVDGFELGKKLFYDPILSKDSSVSCASCHQQQYAFSDGNKQFSTGILGQLGTRNAPAIQNLIWQHSFFSDGGVAHIDFISYSPIENPIEMDESTAHIIQKLSKSAKYKQEFKKTFGDTIINSSRFSQVLTAFLKEMVSSNSKYDQYMRGEATLDDQEKRGMVLFNQKCATCHGGVLQSDFKYRNNGAYSANPMDSGRYHISLSVQDIYLFKTPSLRNIALTAPYMHHGHLNTLEEVLNYYSQSVQSIAPIDPMLKDGIRLSKIEQTQIILFLKTLTDESFLNENRLKQ